MTDKWQQQLDESDEARRQGNAERARHLVEELAPASDEPHRQSVILARRARLDRDEGKLETAAEGYRTAMNAASTAGNPLLEAHHARHLADIERERGILDAASEALNHSLALYQEHSTDELTLANALRSKALLQEAIGDQSAAATSWTEAKDIYARAGIQAGVAESEQHLAELGQQGGS